MLSFFNEKKERKNYLGVVCLLLHKVGMDRDQAEKSVNSHDENAK